MSVGAAVLTGILLFSAGGPPRFLRDLQVQCTQPIVRIYLMLSALPGQYLRDLAWLAHSQSVVTEALPRTSFHQDLWKTWYFAAADSVTRGYAPDQSLGLASTPSILLFAFGLLSAIGVQQFFHGMAAYAG